MNIFENPFFISGIIKKIEHLECSPTGYLMFNLFLDIDTGLTIYKVRNSLNQSVINTFCKCKVGDLVNVLLHKPCVFEYTCFDDKPDFICDCITILNS